MPNKYICSFVLFLVFSHSILTYGQTPVTLNMDSLYELGERYKANSEYEKAVSVYKEIIDKSSEVTDDYQNLVSQSYLYLSLQYYHLNENISALDYAFKGLAYAEKHHKKELYIKFYTYISAYFSVFGDYESSYHYYLKSLEYINSTQDLKWKNTIIGNLIMISSYLHHYDEAAKYYLQYINQNKGKEKPLDYQFFKPYYRSQICKNSNHYRLALNYMKEAIEKAQTVPNSSLFLAGSYNELSQLYSELNNLDSALFYVQLSDKLALANNFKKEHLENLKLLSQIYRDYGDENRANRYLVKYYVLADSVISYDKLKRVENAHYNRILTEQENEIKDINHKSDKQALIITQQTHAVILILLLLCSVVVILIYVIYQKRQLSASYAKLFEQNLKGLHRELCSDSNYSDENGLDTTNAQSQKKSAILNKYEEPENNEMDNDQETMIKLGLTEKQYKGILKEIEQTMLNPNTFCNPNFSIDMLSKFVGAKSKQVSYIISSTYHKNFRTFLTGYRIREAELRILNTQEYGDYTLQQISESVGYKSYSYFVNVFKEITGLTPSTYQKMSKEKFK